MNFARECQRLCEGFVTSLQNLRIGQTISDMLGIATPEWEKSPGLLVSYPTYFIGRQDELEGIFASSISVLKSPLQAVLSLSLFFLL